MELSGWRVSLVMAAGTPPVCIPTLERGNEKCVFYISLISKLYSYNFGDVS